MYEHPQYTPESLKAQQAIAALSDGRVAYAGAYLGWGFHEDGALVRSPRRRKAGPPLGSRPGRPRGCCRSGGARVASGGTLVSYGVAMNAGTAITDGAAAPAAAIYRTSISHVRQSRR